MFIGYKEVNKDGLILKMDVAPFLKDSRTFVPIRFVAEGLGYNVEWNEREQSVTIYGRRKYFDTMDDAAFDWAMHWNCYSLASAREISGVIYKNESGYYWGGIIRGQVENYQVAFDLVEAKKVLQLSIPTVQKSQPKQMVWALMM